VLKQFFKALTTLTLLVGCYFGYIHVFATVVSALRTGRLADPATIVGRDSTSKRQSINYAKASFGIGHWSTAADLGYRYYNAERGFWMYARAYERIVEENGVRYDGKRIKLRPFALITKSHDGKNTKTITGDLAILDMSEPLGLNLNPNGESPKIKHARLEGNVWVHDDKNTPNDPSDDMKVGPITTAEYDEPTQQIRTDSHVVIQDPDMIATGDGMLIQLRKDDGARPGGSTAGFSGAERLDLLRNVHVVIHNAGGIMPASNSSPSNHQPAGTRLDQAPPAPGETASTTVKSEPPTPLDIRCDLKMQVYLPKPRLPVLIGPPAPPAPTVVQFDRNVVCLRGAIDDQPDQLTADMLKLSLVSGEQAHTANQPDSTQSSPPSAPQDVKAPESENSALFGGLTLQRAYATGHVVWLNMPKQGVKLRCNELIHLRQAPSKPDTTYFSGDATRPIEIDKVDISYDETDELDPGTVTSVTHIWAKYATVFDNGKGMDMANVRAAGPGRYETRPDRDQSVEKIAIWQDEFILRNELGPEGQLLHKIIDLTGDRPVFIDKLQDTRLDSAKLIKVTLKPTTVSPKLADKKPATEQIADAPRATLAGVAQRLDSPPGERLARTRTSAQTTASQGEDSQVGQGSSKLQIERLVALADVHLLAPGKTMNASQRLDAEFYEAEQSIPSVLRQPAVTNPQQVTGPEPIADPEAIAVPPRAPDSPESNKKSTEPPTTASAERIWARVMLKPKPEQAATPEQSASKPPSAISHDGTVTSSSKRKTSSKVPGASSTDAELRMAWLWGNASLHQDPEEGQVKGQDAGGEAMYLDNRGPGKAIIFVFQRDPTETTYLPGPLPPAAVDKEGENIKITVAGVLKMNQETDQAWAEGPGTLTQLVDRGFLSDKSGNEPDDLVQPNEITRPDESEQRSETTGGETDDELRAKAKQHKLSAVPVNDDEAEAKEDPDSELVPKPKTRAGRPVPAKEPMVIGFSESMEFAGRSNDPEDKPAAVAIFYGSVTAQTEDALLHGDEKMIVYTDRVVPLAQLGALSQARADKRAGTDDEDGDKSKPQITQVFSYRNAIAINRKVDPDAPRALQQQRIEADDVLAYNRETGHFFVPGKGKVYLYDQDDNSSETSGPNGTGGVTGNEKSKTKASRRTVTPTSAHLRTDSDTAGSTPDLAKSKTHSTARPAKDLASREEPPSLVLTQIDFTKGMRGRFGTGRENDQSATRWAEFFGNIETVHAKVANTYAILDPDRLPSDGFFLTGQTMRVITEPPPVGSPPATPPRKYVKAWENAFVRSTDWRIGADVVTYDSYKDLIYAVGENGHNVIYAQQHAAGQPTSPGSAQAVQLNPKTGALNLVNSDRVQMLDKKTGIRPSPALAPDPFAKPKKKTKRPFRLPPANLERRGFTGQ
jgi:hypothetical protein